MRKIIIVSAVLLFFIASSVIGATPQATKGKESKAQSEKKVRLTDYKDLDLKGLSKEQEAMVQDMISESQMKYCTTKSIADFLKEDSENALAKQLTNDIITKIKEGKSEKDIQVEVKRALRSARALPDVNVDSVYEINIKNDMTRGPENAPVTFIEFSDFQCPYCAGLSKIVNQVFDRFPGDIKHVFKNFPLQFHQFARISAKASLAAGQQGKFWEMRQKLFDNFKSLSQDNINKYATDLGLDMDKFKKDLDDPKIDAIIEEDIKDGELADVGGTPTVFINGKRYTGKRSVDDFSAYISNITGKPYTPLPPQAPSAQPPQPVQPPQPQPTPPQQPPQPQPTPPPEPEHQ